MTTKSTSGPWHQDGAIPRQIMTKDGQPIARVSANQVASARLIAAAPDLLAALVELVGEWDESHADEDHRTGYTLDTGGISMARAAIAKATGE